jgi:CBS domain-containing protein
VRDQRCGLVSVDGDAGHSPTFVADASTAIGRTPQASYGELRNRIGAVSDGSGTRARDDAGMSGTAVRSVTEGGAMKVRDVMTTDVRTVTPGMSLKEAAETLVEAGISGVPVVDAEGGVLGVLSEGDLLFKERTPEERPGAMIAWLFDPLQLDEYRKHAARVVGEAMTAPALTIAPERPLSAAASFMLDRGVNRLPVVDATGKLVGIVTRADLVRAFARADAEVAREIRDGVIRRQMWLEAGEVEVEVDAGEVFLRGTVERRDDAEVLPRLVAKVPGVVGVTSELTWAERA